MQLLHWLSLQSFCILLVISLCVSSVTGATGCGATVQLIERAGSWTENGSLRTIYDILISNPTASCSFGSPVTIALTPGAGCSVASSWNFVVSSGQVTTYQTLGPMMSYSGAGFVLVGVCVPSATVTAADACACTTTGSPADATTTGAATTGAATTAAATTGTGTTAAATTGAAGTTTGGSTTGSSQIYHVNLVFLILTCTATDIRLAVAAQTLDSVGSMYDVIDASVVGTAITLSLTNPDGSGKYYAIVSTTELACWSAAQQAQIASYETTFHVKVVILYSFPYATNGVTIASIGGNSQAGVAEFTTALSSLVKSIPSTAQIPVSGVFAYPSTISDATLATSAITITYSGSSTTYVLAAFITYPDGRKRFEFYVDQAVWATLPVVFGNAWLEWVSDGLFAGMRRVEINAQVDDIFMSTGMWDITIANEGTTSYRITPDDLTTVVSWQTSLNARLPAGSHFVLTFPFNGGSVQENGGYTSDQLFITAKAVRDNFYWESHSWDHPEFDGMTYAAVLEQFTKNNVAALQLFNNNLNSSFFNTKSCVTPSITGLLQAPPLQAMYDFGIRNVVGDNSRPELVPTYLYHGVTTTVAKNGFAGMYIVPRHVTNIYYDGSVPADIVSQYNYRYHAYWGKDLTFDEIIASEVETHTKLLLSYRHDPFMFHQANLRAFSYGGSTTSLVAHWADELITNLLKFSTLPILSHRHDDLAQIFKDRETRDACGFSAKLNIDAAKHQILGFSAASTGVCKFAVTGATAAQATVETYGPDKTMWFQMQPGTPLAVTFTTPITQQ